MQETADTGSFVPLKYITESFYLNNILLEKVKDFRSLSQSEWKNPGMEVMYCHTSHKNPRPSLIGPVLYFCLGELN